MFILKNGKKTEFNTYEELLKNRDENKYLVDDIYFNEFPIDKIELSKLYMLFARGGYFEEGYCWEESIAGVFGSVILQKFNSHTFNYKRIVYIKKDDKFYFEDYIHAEPNEEYEKALTRNITDYKGIMKSIEMIKPFLEFVKDYDLVQCTFDKEVVKKFKKKFGRKNYHLD